MRSPSPEFFDLSADRGHGPDDLVAEDQGQFGLGEFAVDDVQVGAADAAGVDPDEHLLRAGRGDRDFLVLQRAARLLQDHGAHGFRDRHVISALSAAA